MDINDLLFDGRAMSDTGAIDTEPLESVRNNDRDVVELVARCLVELFEDRTDARDWGVTPLHVNNSDDIDYLVTAYYPKTLLSFKELCKIKDIQRVRVAEITVDYEVRDKEGPLLKVEVLVLGRGSAMAVSASVGSNNAKKRKLHS